MSAPRPLVGLVFFFAIGLGQTETLADEFLNPPESAWPGVYWYFMDGNLDGASMTADLESMKEAGLGNLVFLEVNVGLPRGPVDFMSDEWQDLFAHAVHEAERLGIAITLGVGPGWTGSGGPWIDAAQSMQHLVASAVDVKGPALFEGALPLPEPRPPTRYSRLSPELVARRNAFYRDVSVLAFPTTEGAARIDAIVEKALYDRLPFSSVAGVKPFLPSSAEYPLLPHGEVIDAEKIIDLSDRLRPDGTLAWDVPPGGWTILRFCSRNNGSNTRPAPRPGWGFECDKFDRAAFDVHFDHYVGRLLDKVGRRESDRGWTTLHMDSWEMGAQNWTARFGDEFLKRRGYDPRPFFPAYAGRIVGSLEQTERFLFDLRITAQELVLENHARHLKERGRQHGFDLSIEPYDMNPCADLDLGAVADVPMCEFWSDGYGFDTAYSCHEATSVAHTMGRSIVSAEAFTANHKEGWKQYPRSMKNQGDWAFSMGINRFVYHTFAHKPLGDAHRPGMTMGPYGIHWDRGQTFWPMVDAYHRYVARCSHILRRGVTVSDILYLTPEGAPHVFRPPPSALDGDGMLGDKRGFGFDGCSPAILTDRAVVHDGRIVFPGATSYRLLVLPQSETMTPALLETIAQLVEAGATVVGPPPVKSPSLSDYPACDQQVRSLAEWLWGGLAAPETITARRHGEGVIFWGRPLAADGESLYPGYEAVAALLKNRGAVEDFTASGPVRYTHRRTAAHEIYFVSNRSDRSVEAECRFRVDRGAPELWVPMTGQRRLLPRFERDQDMTAIPMRFEAQESFFVIFPRDDVFQTTGLRTGKENFPRAEAVATLDRPWEVSFDPAFGGPERVTFDRLVDWTDHEKLGIKYYSGIATYRTEFDLPAGADARSVISLDLGRVHDIARVRLNGTDLGVVWTAPWRVAITGAVRAKRNRLEIDVANRWPNRLIGDQREPDAAVRTVKWDSGLLGGREFETGRYTFAPRHPFSADSELLPSGLLGPVMVCTE